MNKEECLYIAGLFDGEGFISLSSQKRVSPRVGITNTNLDVLEWVKTVSGVGSIHIKTKNIHHKQAYELRINGMEAILFIEKLFPFLRIKKTRAEVIMEFKKTMQPVWNKTPISEEKKIERNRIKNLLHTLNLRGCTAPEWA